MNNESLWTLIKYKSDSSDSVMGCHMASYYSDFDIETELSPDKLIEKIAAILVRNSQMQINESGYGIVIMKGGLAIYNSVDNETNPYLYSWDDDKELEYEAVKAECVDIIKKATEISDVKIAEAEEKEKADNKAKLDHKKKMEEESEKLQYQRLKEKFSDQ